MCTPAVCKVSGIGSPIAQIISALCRQPDCIESLSGGAQDIVGVINQLCGQLSFLSFCAERLEELDTDLMTPLPIPRVLVAHCYTRAESSINIYGKLIYVPLALQIKVLERVERTPN